MGRAGSTGFTRGYFHSLHLGALGVGNGVQIGDPYSLLAGGWGMGWRDSSAPLVLAPCGWGRVGGDPGLLVRDGGEVGRRAG